MPSLASHICPKCHEARNQEAFRRKNGELAGWCSWCRANHRGRLIRLRQRQEVIKKGFDLNAAEIIAKAEGYASHPLANLLALSHIAGAKRALAIRDGKSWRGKKAWGEYYRAQRELLAMIDHAGAELRRRVRELLEDFAPQGGELATLVAGVMRELRGRANPNEVVAITREWLTQRDPNSEPVSSKGEDSNG